MPLLASGFYYNSLPDEQSYFPSCYQCENANIAETKWYNLFTIKKIT